MTRHTPRFALQLCRGAAALPAQRLRFEVFVDGMGARGGPLTDRARRVEADRFDAHATHLLLLDGLRGGLVVGTARVMDGADAAAAGGFPTEEEFDVDALRRSGRRLLEVGRTCLRADARGGAALHRLWQGLAAVAAERGSELLFGLASFPGADGASAGPALDRLRREHLAPPALRPRALRPVSWPVPAAAQVGPAGGDGRAAALGMPPLVKTYLRLGARVGEGAVADEAFGCVDVCMVLDTGGLSARARALYGAGP